MKLIKDLKIKIYADGANKEDILKLYANPLIKGFTTNPSLMKKAGVVDYTKFALDVLTEIKDRDISFEVFSDHLDGMVEQGLKIGSWGKNVYVKIPVMNSKGEYTYPAISKLSENGIKLNITAVYTVEQVRDIVFSLKSNTPAVISVFAGRMADVGIDPNPCILASSYIVKMRDNTELLWASTRELWNIYQAEELGCHIITAPNDVLQKLKNVGTKTPNELTRETVNTFLKDATEVGYSI
jgi:transaldolase